MKLRKKLYTIIFGTETPAGKAFDVVLLTLIILIVTVVILESVSSISETSPRLFVDP